MFSKIKAKRRIRVVIDCGNGSTGVIARELFGKGGFEVKTLFEEVDGNFPNRNLEPLSDPLTELKRHSKNADIGIAYDGDGDRMAVVDERGKVLAPEQVSYFILSDILSREKGPVVANVESTNLIDMIAKKFGRRVIRIRVGHTFLVQAANRYKACYGTEVSGHSVMPSLAPFDDTLGVSFYFACLLSRKEKHLSEIVEGVPVLPFERMKFKCRNDETKFEIMKRIKKRIVKKFKKTNMLDGVRIDFDGSWVLIRPSNTEPVIRLTVEAKTKKRLEELKKKFSKTIRDEIRDTNIKTLH